MSLPALEARCAAAASQLAGQAGLPRTRSAARPPADRAHGQHVAARWQHKQIRLRSLQRLRDALLASQWLRPCMSKSPLGSIPL